MLHHLVLLHSIKPSEEPKSKRPSQPGPRWKTMVCSVFTNLKKPNAYVVFKLNTNSSTNYSSSSIIQPASFQLTAEQGTKNSLSVVQPASFQLTPESSTSNMTPSIFQLASAPINGDQSASNPAYSHASFQFTANSSTNDTTSLKFTTPPSRSNSTPSISPPALFQSTEQQAANNSSSIFQFPANSSPLNLTSSIFQPAPLLLSREPGASNLAPSSTPVLAPGKGITLSFSNSSSIENSGATPGELGSGASSISFNNFGPIKSLGNPQFVKPTGKIEPEALTQELIIELRDIIDSRTSSGDTALLLLCRSSHIRSVIQTRVEGLLSAGADVNIAVRNFNFLWTILNKVSIGQ